MTDFIETYDDALSPEFCRELIQLFEASPYLVQGRTGGGVDLDKKVSSDLALDRHSEYRSVVDRLRQTTAHFVLKYFLTYKFGLIAPVALSLKDPNSQQPVTLTLENFERLAAGNEIAILQKLYRLGAIQMQRYRQGKGNYNYWHCETYPQKGSVEPLHRALLFMYYLNDVTEGGETEFYYQQRSLSPKAGQLVIAPAYFTHTHRGKVPLSGDKFILTSWVLHSRAEQLFN